MKLTAPLAQCMSCYNLRSGSYNIITAPVFLSRRKCFLSKSQLQIPATISDKRAFACHAVMGTDPENSEKEEKEVLEDGTTPPSVDDLVLNSESVNDENKDELASTKVSRVMDSLQKINRVLNAPNGIQTKDEPASTEFSELKKSLEKIDGVLSAPDSIEKKDDVGDAVEVTSGSPLPGMKQVGEPIKFPKATIDILKGQVFGFDTFFVTSHEPYETGVLFKGNLRGKAATCYEKIMKRMEDIFGDQYRLFLLINPEDDMPVAVVVPRQTLQPEPTAVPEWLAASAFGLVTIFTLLLRNVPALQSNLLSVFDNLELLKDGLPGALVTALILGFHEVGHVLVARNVGAKLGVPFFVPSWQIGSFGAITRIVNIMSNREDLLKLAAAGPLAGFSLGLFLLVLGFILPPSDGIGIVINSGVFHESFLAGGIAKLLLGDALREGAPISVNPLVIWAWAGLLINAINSIPAGELDGGRISFALWGRKVSSRLNTVTLGLVGISSLFSDVAFYWVVLVFFLQRGPIAPLSEEITEPENKYLGLGIAVLLLGLLVCLPYPFSFNPEAASINF